MHVADYCTCSTRAGYMTDSFLPYEDIKLQATSISASSICRVFRSYPCVIYPYFLDWITLTSCSAIRTSSLCSFFTFPSILRFHLSCVFVLFGSRMISNASTKTVTGISLVNVNVPSSRFPLTFHFSFSQSFDISAPGLFQSEKIYPRPSKTHIFARRCNDSWFQLLSSTCSLSQTLLKLWIIWNITWMTWLW